MRVQTRIATCSRAARRNQRWRQQSISQCARAAHVTRNEMLAGLKPPTRMVRFDASARRVFALASLAWAIFSRDSPVGTASCARVSARQTGRCWHQPTRTMSRWCVVLPRQREGGPLRRSKHRERAEAQAVRRSSAAPRNQPVTCPKQPDSARGQMRPSKVRFVASASRPGGRMSALPSTHSSRASTNATGLGTTVSAGRERAPWRGLLNPYNASRSWAASESPGYPAPAQRRAA